MPRLFIAVDLPDEHKTWLARLRDASIPGRWTPTGQYHLTLRFIGEVDEARAAAIEQALAAVRAEAFSLRGRGLGVFPSVRKPRVLFAAIDPEAALMRLQAQIEETVAAPGINAEVKPFHPHVTLARLREPRARVVRAFLRTHASFVLPPFAVTHVYLYESILRPEGSLHQRRAAFALRASS